LKRLPTIIDKLNRFPDMKLSRMQDIGGIRAVLISIKDLDDVYDDYKNKTRFTHQLVRERNYVEEPKTDGYRGVHLIYRYNNTSAKNGLADLYEGLYVELQLRTELQHIWATAVETIGTLKGSSFKTGSGNHEWRIFFALVSSAFAIAEDSPVLAAHKNILPVDLYEQIKKVESRINALETLNGLTAAASFVEDTREDGYYKIISLDMPNKRISIVSFARDEFLEATKAYSAKEVEAARGVDVVLVSVGDINQLKAAYPNYFLDLKEFIEKVKVLIEEAS
jgi:putative GTP pyrophosphokinase